MQRKSDDKRNIIAYVLALLVLAALVYRAAFPDLRIFEPVSAKTSESGSRTEKESRQWQISPRLFAGMPEDCRTEPEGRISAAKGLQNAGTGIPAEKKLRILIAALLFGLLLTSLWQTVGGPAERPGRNKENHTIRYIQCADLP